MPYTQGRPKYYVKIFPFVMFESHMKMTKLARNVQGNAIFKELNTCQARYNLNSLNK